MHVYEGRSSILQIDTFREENCKISLEHFNLRLAPIEPLVPQLSGTGPQKTIDLHEHIEYIYYIAKGAGAGAGFENHIYLFYFTLGSKPP